MNLMVRSLMLLLNLYFVHAQQQACPLNFTSVPYKQDTTCPLKHESGLEPTDCCKVAVAYVMRVIGLHTNKTEGQPLFLSREAEAVCWNSTRQLKLGVDYDYCEFGPPKYSAYNSPCNFGTVQELKQNLTANQLDFGALLRSCQVAQRSNVEAMACLNKFSATSKNLSDALQDDLDTCAGAILITMISTDIKNETWVLFLINMFSHQDSNTLNHKKERVFEISLIFVCCCIGFGALITGLSYIRRRHMSRKDSDKVVRSFKGSSSNLSGSKPLLHSQSLYAFSRKEVWKATRNFNSENFIGAGSAGMVHKGVLPSGQLVAVKHIDKEKKADTFFKEVESLSKVRHPNLVSLLGYCQSGEDYYLVYEYCAKGNLWQWLFDDRRPLTWEERLNIALGSARGLLFLHTNPGGVIVHRDVKPTNILLNDNMEAKLSDFGLSRFIAMEESHVYTEVKGTSGYLDPEYMSRGQLTLASDIYSFGIVLLQLVSGRRPIDFDLAHRYSLLTSAKRVVEKGSNISNFVDPQLKGRYSAAAAKSIVEAAVFCTSQSSHNRPSIKEVKDIIEAATNPKAGHATLATI